MTRDCPRPGQQGRGQAGAAAGRRGKAAAGVGGATLVVMYRGCS